LLAKPDKVVLIDVRRPDEVAANGGFPVYLSIQLSELEKNLAWIPKDRTIVTVSNHAGRGGRAADLLASKGFKVAGTVGAQTYEQQGGKIAHIAAPVTAAKN
jgi:rhodanese-related sulfurtransferase